MTSPEAEEAVADLLLREFGSPPSAYQRAESSTTTLSVYLDRKPAHWDKRRQQLTRGLSAIKSAGLSIFPARTSLQRVPREDWAESWKRHFRPFQIGTRLLVKPSWSRQRARKQQVQVVIDPGLSFGTGQHPTTRFCLEEIVKTRETGTRQSLLDLGTGSGILAIAAAKLGYFPIEAIEIDREALAIAQHNARHNHVAQLIKFRHADVTQLHRRLRQPHTVVCANLISRLLCSEAGRLVRLVHPGGTLILAGILQVEFPVVREVYESYGMQLKGERREQEWHSASFCASSKIV